MDDPNITMEEYIRLEEEKDRRSGRVYNWETATYGKICPQHIDEFDETSLSEYDGEEQNVIYFNDLFSFNVIYPNDLSDKDNDNDKIDIEQSSWDLSIEPLPNVVLLIVNPWKHSIAFPRQKNTLAEYMILSGCENRPPMLDKDLYDSWKSRMELYMQNREHERMILESVKNGPLIWATVEEN
ncbi:hypothetical protein Tco_1237995 [Tanacetum coccineum]